MLHIVLCFEDTGIYTIDEYSAFMVFSFLWRHTISKKIKIPYYHILIFF